jgi:hypothetical protein
MGNIGWDCGGEYRMNLVLVKRCEEVALFQGFLYPVFGLICLWNYLRDILLISDSTFSTHASPAKGEGVLPPFLHISYSTKSVSLLSQMNTEATYLWRYEELLGVELNRTELNQIYKPKQQTGFEYKMKPLQAVIHLQVSLQLAMVFIYP